MEPEVFVIQYKNMEEVHKYRNNRHLQNNMFQFLYILNFKGFIYLRCGNIYVGLGNSNIKMWYILKFFKLVSKAKGKNRSALNTKWYVLSQR